MDINPGDVVLLIPESGFHAGKRFVKTVANVIIQEWSPEERRRLKVPASERTLTFTDGTRASHYDDVRKLSVAEVAAMLAVPPSLIGSPVPYNSP